MNAKRLAWIALSGACVWACAQGASDGDLDDDGSGAASSGGGGGAASGSGGQGPGPATGGSGPAGGGDGAGEPSCTPPEHLCAGMCVGNTPQTGCYQSTSCTACPPVVNGTTKCDPTGICDFDCQPPYAKSGSFCTCPTQCCSNNDCGAGATCQNGQCIQPCDETACLLMCFPGLGVCVGAQCFCVS